MRAVRKVCVQPKAAPLVATLQRPQNKTFGDSPKSLISTIELLDRLSFKQVNFQGPPSEVVERKT
jgi:hypothetical protein